MACPARWNCPLLNQAHAALEAEVTGWVRAYCDHDSASCERRRLAEAGAEVPDDLLPDGGTLITIEDLGEAVA